jgi:penicillin-binding protein 2
LILRGIKIKIKEDMKRDFFKISRKKQRIESLNERREDPFLVQEGKYDFRGLKDSFYYADWTESSFLSDPGQKEIVSRSFDFRRLRPLSAIFIFFITLVLFRVFWLQIIKHDYYLSLSEDNRLRAEIIEAQRGIIYTNDMKPLVRNKANFVLYLKPMELPRDELLRDNLFREISSVLDGDGEGSEKQNEKENSRLGSLEIIGDKESFYKLKEAVSGIRLGSLESYQPLFVADNIDYDKAMLIAIKLHDWPGVFLSNKIRREYLSPLATSSPLILGEDSLSHILGYTGKISPADLENLGPEYQTIDYIGKMGIEYSWEKELKGLPGKKNIEVDALGRQKKIINEVPAFDGYNLQLSIDSALQEKIEEVAKAYLEKVNLHRASIIAINPNNGEIMAMVSLPAYNNNLFAKGISQEEYSDLLNNPDRPLFNRSISGEFPSGSTIKPVFAAGALQEGVINENTSFLSNGGLRIGEWFFPDWKAGGHGQTNVRKAIAWSVNTFFYYIGGGYGDFRGLGIDGLVKYAKLFGLGQITGVDLPGERSGFVPTAEWKQEIKGEPWYIGDTYHFSIGQGDLIVTPLQVANYTAALANGGTLYQPHLVSRLLDSGNSLVKEIKPKIIASNLVDQDKMKIVREGMRETVTAGSARSLSILPVSAAGKTGTAQWSTKKEPHAWFIGFAPYDQPKIALAVLVEEGVEGSAIAVPIAKDVLNWYFSFNANQPTASSSNIIN